MNLIDYIKDNNIEGVRTYILNCDNIENEINNIFMMDITSLLWASKNGYIEIVKLLLDVEGIDVNMQTSNGYNSLLLASRNGFTEIVKLLLEVDDIDVNMQDSSGFTALILISKNGFTKIVKLLLEVDDIDVNMQDSNGFTALIRASTLGYDKIVEMLLEVDDIDVKIQNNYGRTALMSAACGHNEIVKLLISKGANSIKPLDPNEYKDLAIDDRVGIFDILINWKIYLPKWNLFKTYSYYPKEFKDIAIAWMLVCKKKNNSKICIDIKLLLIEYFAESWKLT